MVYLLTAIGLTAGGSCTVHIYTQTIHRTTQNKQYMEQHKRIQYIKEHKYDLEQYKYMKSAERFPSLRIRKWIDE
jgi:hypothetical protein